MGHRGTRRRLAIAALALAMGAAAVACSSGSGGKNAVLGSGAGGPGSTAAAAGSASAPTGGATSDSPSTASGAGQPAGGSGTTTPHPGATTVTTKPAHPVATTAATAPKVTVPVATGPAPTALGTYNYAVSGTLTLTTNGQSATYPESSGTTLVVAPGANPGTEVWTLANTIISNLAFTTSGVFLTAETVTYAPTGTSVTCTFTSPVPMPPWPLAAGPQFTGHATCGSAGAFTLTVQVMRPATPPVGGTAVTTFLVHSELTSASLKVKEDDWYAPSLRLPVVSQIVINAGLGTASFTSAATYSLRSS